MLVDWRSCTVLSTCPDFQRLSVLVIMAIAHSSWLTSGFLLHRLLSSKPQILGAYQGPQHCSIALCFFSNFLFRLLLWPRTPVFRCILTAELLDILCFTVWLLGILVLNWLQVHERYMVLELGIQRSGGLTQHCLYLALLSEEIYCRSQCICLTERDRQSQRPARTLTLQCTCQELKVFKEEMKTSEKIVP